jgi:hypothetical protein
MVKMSKGRAGRRSSAHSTCIKSPTEEEQLSQSEVLDCCMQIRDEDLENWKTAIFLKCKGVQEQSTLLQCWGDTVSVKRDGEDTP